MKHTIPRIPQGPSDTLFRYAKVNNCLWVWFFFSFIYFGQFLQNCICSPFTFLKILTIGLFSVQTFLRKPKSTALRSPPPLPVVESAMTVVEILVESKCRQISATTLTLCVCFCSQNISQAHGTAHSRWYLCFPIQTFQATNCDIPTVLLHIRRR